MSSAILLSRMATGFLQPWRPLHLVRNYWYSMGDSSTLLLVGFRHGNRNPARFLNPQSKFTWGTGGELALNDIGGLQASSLGAKVRDFLEGYGRPDSIDCYSSSAERCLKTLEIVRDRLGLLIDSITVDDEMLRMYAVDHPRNEEVWKPISSACTDDLLPVIQKDLRRRDDLVQYLRKKTGWQMTVSDLADLADNVEEMKKFGEALPSWLRNPNLPGYDRYRILKEIAEFSEYSQIACSRYAPCRDLMSDHWLRHIVESIKKVKAQHDTEPGATTVALYATHTEVILSLMRRMGMAVERVATTGGFVAEIRFSSRNEGRVRLFEMHPDGDSHRIVKANLEEKLPRDEQWMSIEFWRDWLIDNNNVSSEKL